MVGPSSVVIDNGPNKVIGGLTTIWRRGMVLDDSCAQSKRIIFTFNLISERRRVCRGHQGVE